jgi:glycine/D-amino acid oxidase-like deaminating enzyme
VVLGAGISGAFVAQRLVNEGLDIALLEKRDVCAGSTSASTALLQYEIDTSLVDLSKRIGRLNAVRAYRLCHDSINAIEHLVTELSIDCMFQRRKSVYLASRPSDAPLLREEGAARQAAGIDVEYWDEARIETRFSFSRAGALVSQQGAEVDGHRLAHALLGHAARMGARIFDRTVVEKYEAAPTPCDCKRTAVAKSLQSMPSLPPAMSHRIFFGDESSNLRAPMPWPASH